MIRGGGNGGSTPAGTASLRLLFFLRSIHYDRVLENFLRAVLERGHEIHVALALEKRGLGAGKTKIFDELGKRYKFSYERLPERRDRWLIPAVALRHGLDYLRYLEPEFAHADPLRERARSRAPRLLRMLLAFPFRGRWGRRALGSLLRRLEAAIPVPKEIPALIEERKPDAVLVSPLVGLGSVESDYVRAAQEVGVPTVLVVASWDNLTNKGVIRDVPTMTIVWNELQVEEAVTLHRVPRDRVVAVGAHSFDHWFEWKPSVSREKFAKWMRLDPGRPIILYLGSSFFIAGNETRFVKEWLRHVRSHPRLAEAAIILRPHPQNVVGWDRLEDERGTLRVYPRAGEAPTSERQKIEFFDTLYYSNAVVGINTSALIEASILHRPVLTLVSDHFTTQEGTIHFSYIAHDEEGNGGGIATVGRDWDEHLEQLVAAIESPDAYRERFDRFLAHFVRPNGPEVPAAPAAAEAVERAARIAVEPKRAPLLRPVLVALTPLLSVALPFAHPLQSLRSLAKTVRKWTARRKKAFDRFARDRRRRGEKAEKLPRDVPVLAGDETNGSKEKPEKPLKDKERDKEKEAKARAKAEKAKAKEATRLDVQGADVRPKKGKAARQPARRRLLLKAAKRSRRFGPVMRKRWKRTKGAVRTVYNMRYRPTYKSKLERLPSRNEIPALLNARGLVGRGAEIGVKTGKYSEHLLKNWQGEKLISIDPWMEADPDEYVDRSNVSQNEFEGYYQETKRKLSRFGDRSEIWRLTSVEAAERAEDHSFDFVYIDARHDYASVMEDLNAWFSKVKPGGIFAGHDYVDGMLPQGDFGVKSAVDEFFAARGLPVHGTEGPSAVEMFPSWVVEIPHEPAAKRAKAPELARATDEEPS